MNKLFDLTQFDVTQFDLTQFVGECQRGYFSGPLDLSFGARTRMKIDEKGLGKMRMDEDECGWMKMDEDEDEG
jgi:hypothetical protein